MKHIALPIALVLLLAACGDDDTAATTGAAETTTSAAQTTTTAAETTTTAGSSSTTTGAETTTTRADGPAGTVFQLESVTFGAPMVVIYNIGDEGGSLAGHWICQRPSYAELPDITLEPGEGIAISLGGSLFIPPPGVEAADGQLNIGTLSPTSGEVALYSSNSFSDPEAIVSYVEWGQSDHGRSSVAVSAGIWQAGAFVATTADTPLIQVTDFGDVSASGWTAF